MIRTAQLVGNTDEATKLIRKRQQLEAVLTGPMGSFGKPTPTPQNSKLPPAPFWWKGRVPD